MPERSPSKFAWSRGMWPTTSMVTGVPDCLLAGLNCFNRGFGLFTSAKGWGESVASSGGVKELMNVSDTYGGLTGGGSIVQAFAENVYFYAGVGEAFVEGVSKGSVSGGKLRIWDGTAAYDVGLAAPGPPTIDVDYTEPKNSFCKGRYQVAITQIRSSTGAESTISPPSVVVTEPGAEPDIAVSTRRRQIVITALGTLETSADRIGIYVTKRGFGEIGPFFHFYDEDRAVIEAAILADGKYVIQLPGADKTGWMDGMLGDLAPLDFNPPPVCTFVFAINACIVAAGTYGGAGLSPSYPGQPEAYPARFTLFIPGGGKVTGVKGSGIEGAVLVMTGSSVNLVTASQSDICPLNIRPIWPTTGVVSSDQLCTAGGEIFAWVGTRGPVRDSLGSEGDPGDEATAFAAPMMKFFEAYGYTAENCTVVYDPANDTVWYVKEGADAEEGSIGAGYCRYLKGWHTGYLFPAVITTAVTDSANGRALFSDASGNLYEPETGDGTDWSIVTQFQGGEMASFIKTVISARAIVSASCRMDIYTDLDIVTPNPYGTNLAAGPNHGTFHHLNIPDVKSFAIGLSGTDGGGTELHGVETQEIVHPVRI